MVAITWEKMENSDKGRGAPLFLVGWGRGGEEGGGKGKGEEGGGRRVGGGKESRGGGAGPRRLPSPERGRLMVDKAEGLNVYSPDRWPVLVLRSPLSLRDRSRLEKE